MNAAAAALITDAKQVLNRHLTEAAKRDPLVAAFAGWLHVPGFDVLSLAAVAAQAAGVKGASRSYREVAILGFATTESSLRSKHAADFQGLWIG